MTCFLKQNASNLLALFPCSWYLCFENLKLPPILWESTLESSLHASLREANQLLEGICLWCSSNSSVFSSNSVCLVSFHFYILNMQNASPDTGFGTVPYNKWWYIGVELVSKYSFNTFLTKLMIFSLLRREVFNLHFFNIRQYPRHDMTSAVEHDLKL